MSLTSSIAEYVAAGFPALWIQSFEPDDAINELVSLCHDRSWRIATWDLERGLVVHGDVADSTTQAHDPLSAVRAASELAWPNAASLLVLRNFHRFLGSPEIIQAMERQLLLGKQHGVVLVVLSAVVQIPIELEKQFLVITHELPDRDQLDQIARSLATQPDEIPEPALMNGVLDAACGLTRLEAENAISLSLIRHGRLKPETLWELKTQTLRKSGLLSLYRGGETFADLGGLTAMKEFCLRALSRKSSLPAECRAKGILLLGIPGSGKSSFCKALGNELGRPTIILDVGSLMGGVVGATEENTRRALRIIDAMAPAVLLIDEVEKALAGIHGSGDSGVASRLFGTILSWMNDRTSDVFVVCTSNDVSRLPPEFSRSERLDSCFFLDLPGREEKDAIWNLYRQRFAIDDTELPDDAEWSGSEIKSCCRLARLLDLPLRKAAGHIVPIAVTASETIGRLREWASSRCLDANQSGLYRRTTAAHSSRKVQRSQPSLN